MNGIDSSLDEAVPAHITVAGQQARSGAAKAWLMAGPSPTTDNLTDPAAIGIREAVVEVRDGAYLLTMPGCSMAAVEIAAP